MVRQADRSAPALVVAIAVIFNLVVLHAETTAVPNLNDGALHSSMLRVAVHDIEQGRLPLGAWFPYLSLGSAQFLHYQSLPHTLGGLVGVVFGTANAYYWSLYLLLALWPISVFAGCRMMGWDCWVAAAAALASPLLVNVAGYGYQDSSYTWAGYGVWTQLWGMWLLPLAWGLSWRAVSQGRNFALAALAIALTIACHFLTGYLALLVLVPWVLIDPSQLPRRALRAIIVGAGALLIAAWVLVPLISESPFSGNVEYYRGTFYFDSFGAPQVLGWLFTGQIYDSGRFPIISLLVALGLVLCITRIRRDLAARALISAWTLSLILYFGRPTLGPLLDVLPGSSDLPLHRYINGVHLAGLMLAGVGAIWLVRRALVLSHRVVPRLNVVAPAVGALVAGVALLFPAWTQIVDYSTNGAALMYAQQAADSSDGAALQVLIDRVKAAGDGRVYAGTKANWGHLYTVGDRPVYLELENADVDAIGSWLNTESLSSDPEAHFDERNPADYDLYNVRYLILPNDHPPPVAAQLLARSGRHDLYQVATTGYLEVVDTIGPPIAANRDDIGPKTAGFMESSDLQQRRFPTMAFNGAAAAAPSLTRASTDLQQPAGTVSQQTAALDDGTFSATVQANRTAAILLKTTDEPGWQVTVDGAAAQPDMVAPSFVAVTVSPGVHTVAFRFVPYALYPVWMLVGLVAVLALAFLPRWLPVLRSTRQLQAAGARATSRPSLHRVSAMCRSRRGRYLGAAAVSGVMLALIVAGVLTLTASQPESIQAANDVTAGLAAQNAGMLNAAAADYGQALAHDPRNKLAWYDLGTVETAQGDGVLAVDDYDAALAIDPTFEPALFNVAVASTASNPQLAAHLYEQIIQLDANNADAHLNLGFLLLSQGRNDDARAQFALAVQLNPSLASRIPAAVRP